LKFVKKITQTNLFKISSLNSISVLIKIAVGFVSSKILAIFVGPSGMALSGNLRSFIVSLEGVGSLGFQNGIVKHIAENIGNKKELEKTISTLLISFLLVAFFLSTSLFIFSEYFCRKIFGNNLQYVIVIKIVAVVLPWNAISLLFLSIINGLEEYKKVILATIITNIIGLMQAIVLIYFFKVLGAFLSIIFFPIILVIVTFFYLPQGIISLRLLNFRQYDFVIFKNLSSFSLMVLPPTILSPIFNVKIRNFLISSVGIDKSGLWESITRISNFYLLFIGSILSIYFYPKLIKTKQVEEVKKVIWNYYKLILPLFIVGGAVVYFSRFIIIKILFTNQFLGVSELFFLQLCNDFFKVCGMILGYFLLAQKKVFHYIVIEVLAIFFLYYTSLFFIKTYGLEGVLIAQVLENFTYLIVLVVYFKKYLF
jgi:O-antigen/teichoic acid export membrane protein